MVQQKDQIVCSNILKNQIFRPNVLHQNFIKFNLFHLQVFFCWLRTILYILKSHFLMLDFYFLNQNQVSNNPNHQYLNLVCLAQYFMVELQQEPARQTTGRLFFIIPLFLLPSVFFDFLSPTIIIIIFPCLKNANIHAQFFHFCALFLLFHE